MVRKKKGDSFLGKKISNRLAYTIIAGFALILTGVFVWAFTGTPNPGHNIQSIGAPVGCVAGQALSYNAGASNWWSCVSGGGTITGSGAANRVSFWTGASTLSYDGDFTWDNTNKRLGLGTTSPTSRLHVFGNTILTQNLTVDTSTLFINSNTDKVGIRRTNPEATLDVNGSIRGNIFYGDGGGLTNLRMIVTASVDECNADTQGLMRYRSNLCVGDDLRGSILDVCMRTGNTIYLWNPLKTNTWTDTICDIDGCPPGTYYYECTGQYVAPGCYPDLPEYCYGYSCFTGETLILMADESYKPISEVELGEYVLTKESESSANLIRAKVTKKDEHLVRNYMLINGLLKVTPEHIVFVNGNWKAVGKIEKGDELIGAGGNKIIVESIIPIKESVEIKVYNLEIEKYHTYFAGGFYVHNAKEGGYPLV